MSFHPKYINTYIVLDVRLQRIKVILQVKKIGELPQCYIS